MRFHPLAIAGAYRIEIEPHADERGFFARTFCADAFARHRLAADFVQRSISVNRRRGILRGLHFQAPPHEEVKIVRCTAGAIYDVIVDLRRDSATFARWHAEELTAENRAMLYVPAGCAHGFQALADDSEVYYEITPRYVAEAARGVRWDDPDLAIAWPVAPATLSARDRALPTLSALTAR